MVATKAGELVFEALPGLVLQACALMKSDKTSTAIVSILISAFSAAFTSTTMFWDIDTDPRKKKGSPQW
jgi:hypothetical protein